MHPVEVIAEGLRQQLEDLGYRRIAPFPNQAPLSLEHTWGVQYSNGRYEFRILWFSGKLKAVTTVRCLIREYDFAVSAPVSIALSDVSNSGKIKWIKEQIREYLSKEEAILECFERIKK